MAPHSSTLAWRIRGTGEPGGQPSKSWTRLKRLSSRVGHSWTRLKRLSSSSNTINQVWLVGSLVDFPREPGIQNSLAHH